MNIDFGSAIDHAHLNTVQQLIQASLDSGVGFHEIAADVTDQELSQLFRRWSGECFRQAEQLGESIHADCGLVAMQRTWLDGWRRIWLSARAALNMGDCAMMLQELERAEGYVCKFIEDVLSEVRDPTWIAALRRLLSGTREIVVGLRELRAAPLHTAARQFDNWDVSPVGGSGADRFHEVPAH